MAQAKDKAKKKSTTMEVWTSNHEELLKMKPYGFNLNDWFNESLAAWIEFSNSSERIANSQKNQKKN